MKYGFQLDKGGIFKSVLAFIPLMLMTFFLAYQDHQLTIDHQRNIALHNMVTIRTNIEHSINTSFNLTLGMVVYVANNPDIDTRQFRQLAQILMSRTILLRNVALAKDNIITHIYPLEGNEKALGLNYMDSPSQKESVLKAIETRQSVIAGPVELVQGGKGFINRIPIFLDEAQQNYWGIASLVIDVETLYQLAGLNQHAMPYNIALRGKDSLGAEGEVFYGDPAVFSNSKSLKLPIQLPSGEWIMAAHFNHQNVAFSTRTVVILVAGLLIAISISTAIYLLLKSYRRVKHIAAYDSLTQLANRHLFIEHLQESIALFKRNGIKFSVLLLDLDHFKEVNDTMGHPTGDRLLKAVARRLKKISRASDIIARLGGDEFIILQNDVTEPADSALFARKIIAELSQIFMLDKIQLQTSASIGIVMSEPANLKTELLMKYSDLALYHAKQSGRATYSFHDDDMSQSLVHEIELASDLKHAIEFGQFYMVYQPQISLVDNSLVGVEALIRWQHPEKGLISPDEFITIAEKRGLIDMIGQWGINEVCFQAREWLEQGIDFKKIALNISANHIKTINFSQEIESALAKYQLSASYLELELTESVFVDDFQYIQNVMAYLVEKGVAFSIDDFGTGYSSLSYLKNLNVSYLKIDRMFVKDIHNNKEDVEIVKATLDMAKALRLVTIAEGVELAEQADMLAGLGCEIGQGYLFSYPLKADELVKNLQDSRWAGFKSPSHNS